MQEDKKENKVKTTREIKYDDRRKQLININTEEKEIDLGTIKIRSEGIYNEEGIKKVLSGLYSRKEVLEKDIQMVKEMSDEPPKMNPELEEFKKKLKTLQIINHHETATDDQRKKEKEKLEASEEELEKINEDIKKIKEAVGGRLKI